MRRWSETRGQASSEYVALVALVAVVLALAAGLTSGGIGGEVLAGLQRGVCRVTGTACPPPRPAAADLAPCPLERTTSRETLEGAFELVRLGKIGTLTAVRGSDGKVTVTLADGTTGGGEIGLGAELATGALNVGADASAGVRLTVNSGRVWTLPSAAAARAFLARYGSKATIGGQALDAVRGGCSLLCDAIGWRPHPQLPPPDELSMGHGATLRSEAAFGDTTLETLRSVLLGSRLRRDGTNTWFVQLDRSVMADLARRGLTAGLDARDQAVLSYTVDPRGRPAQLVLHTVVRGAARGGLSGSRGSWTGAARAGAGLVIEQDATLDLHGVANRAVAQAFVGALHHPLARGALRRSIAALRERIAVAGVLDRRVYALSSRAYELGAKLALGAQLGGAFSRTHENMHLLSAETRLPGLPFLPRDDCRAA